MPTPTGAASRRGQQFEQSQPIVKKATGGRTAASKDCRRLGAILVDSRAIATDSELALNPRLFGIGGPIEGAFFALPAEPVTIGRHPENMLVIDDPSVGPRHCLLRPDPHGLYVCAPHAAWPVLVNGHAVREQWLEHGDEIRVGACVFLYLVSEDEDVSAAPHRLARLLPARDRTASRRADAWEEELIGDSPAMRRVRQFIAKVAGSDCAVLLLGESGTGKEMVARAIHRSSRRAKGPFVAINCASLTETLLESELFGHERGAFTGAVALKRGKLELAHSGTLFLDEVGELAPGLQSKLLRVLQLHEFERVGGVQVIRVDLRVAAACNRDLAAAVQRGAFRSDLYYRLNVVSLQLPPLRERKQDILLLAEHFAARFAARENRKILGFVPEARQLLLAHSWPGNVRELENAVESAVVLGSGEWILPEDLPQAISSPPEACGSDYAETVREARRKTVQRALEQASGNYAEAARILGIHPNNLHRLIRTLGLRKPEAAGPPGGASR